jgi:ADP-ribosyl-[dinitrogen reductase] hydrolase
MLGAIIGDIAGAARKGGGAPAPEAGLLGPGGEFTDESVLTMAVADALLHGHHPRKALFLWGTRHPKRGYDEAFSNWLDTWELSPYGGCGCGAAARVSPAALLAASLDEALWFAVKVSQVTHDHPGAIKGAKATAHAIFLARFGADAAEIRRTLERAYGYDMDRPLAAMHTSPLPQEGPDAAVPNAIACALEANSFEEAIGKVVTLAGDTDAFGAITGPLAEALFGIPDGLARRVVGGLPEDMRETLQKLYAHTEYANPVPGLRPAIPAGQLRRRYEALLPIVELPGKRTFRIRLGQGWESFLFHGPATAAWLRERLAQGGADAQEPAAADCRDLVALVLEAWPATCSTPPGPTAPS